MRTARQAKHGGRGAALKPQVEMGRSVRAREKPNGVLPSALLMELDDEPHDLGAQVQPLARCDAATNLPLGYPAPQC